MKKKLIVSAAMSVFILSPHAADIMKQTHMPADARMMSSVERESQRFSPIDQAAQIKEMFVAQPKEKVKISGYSVSNMIEMLDFSDLAYKKVGVFQSVEDDTRVIMGENKLAEGWKVYRFASTTENSGFVFVEPESKGGRIIVSYKGSDSTENYITDLKINMAYDKKMDARIHNGFLLDYRKTDFSIKKILRKIQEEKGLSNSDFAPKITITGHSLGGALANLQAVSLSKELNAPVGLVTFAAPRPFDLQAAEEAEKILGHKAVRIEIKGDAVPTSMVAMLFNTKHVGQHVQLIADPSLGTIDRHYLKNIRPILERIQKEGIKITDFHNTKGGFANNTPVVKQLHQARMWFGKYIGRNVHKQFSLGKDRVIDLACEAAEEAAKMPQTAINAASAVIGNAWTGLKSWWK